MFSGAPSMNMHTRTSIVLRSIQRLLALLIAGSMLLLFSATARAFTIQSPVSSGCHEQITQDALLMLQPGPQDLTLLQAQPLSPEQQRLFDNLKIQLPQGTGFVAASLIAGVRWNDLLGNDPIDLLVLNAAHNSNQLSAMHCIRRSDEDEPEGSRLALARCRAFIEAELANALALRSTDDSGAAPTPGPWDLLHQEVLVPEYLPSIGATQVHYAALGFHLGRALHAIQDSHTHSYRDADGQVTVVLNWMDMVSGHLTPARDGPAHLSSLDHCKDPDPRVQRGYEWAVRDSAAFLNAVMAADTLAVELLLDGLFAQREGCTEANLWCQTRPEEHLLGPPSSACTIHEQSRTDFSLLLLPLLIFSLRRQRKKRAPSPPRHRGPALLLLFVLLACAYSSTAFARTSDPVPPTSTPSAKATACGPLCRPWSVELRSFVSLNALAFGFTGEFHYSWPRVGIALGVEVNPWIQHHDLSIETGAISPYLSFLHRLNFGKLSLRQRISLGASILLTETTPYSAGSAGPYVELSALGAEFYARNRRFAFIVDGVSIAVLVVGTKDPLFALSQYRLGLGFRF